MFASRSGPVIYGALHTILPYHRGWSQASFAYILVERCVKAASCGDGHHNILGRMLTCWRLADTPIPWSKLYEFQVPNYGYQEPISPGKHAERNPLDCNNYMTTTRRTRHHEELTIRCHRSRWVFEVLSLLNGLRVRFWVCRMDRLSFYFLSEERALYCYVPSCTLKALPQNKVGCRLACCVLILERGCKMQFL